MSFCRWVGLSSRAWRLNWRKSAYRMVSATPPQYILCRRSRSATLSANADSFEQLDLLNRETPKQNEKQEKLEQAMDAIRGKYGKGAITFGNTGKFSGWDD